MKNIEKTTPEHNISFNTEIFLLNINYRIEY